MQVPYVLRIGAKDLGTKVPAAAWIPTWEQPTHASNVISTNGQRLFFNSFDALLPGDTNGTQDVYQWETLGTGTCKESDPRFFAQNGGCIDLISSGQNPFESEFWEASPDGEDVFFNTEASLVPQDPGSIDLYDARVQGGFPQPVVKEQCEGEACQSPPPPPAYNDGSSATYNGPANVKQPKRKRCAKGKRRVRRGGKARCVKKKGQRRRADRKRRAAR
jgi:hypothetical protein